MPVRLCIEQGCPLVIPSGLRCSRHAAAFEAARSTRRAAYRSAAYKRSRKALLDGRIPCMECGTFKDLTVDHIRPLSRGGTNDPSNLQVLCRRCNAKKGSAETRED